jgi:hypothetical protein
MQCLGCGAHLTECGTQALLHHLLLRQALLGVVVDKVGEWEGGCTEKIEKRVSDSVRCKEREYAAVVAGWQAGSLERLALPFCNPFCGRSCDCGSLAWLHSALKPVSKRFATEY